MIILIIKQVKLKMGGAGKHNLYTICTSTLLLIFSLINTHLVYRAAAHRLPLKPALRFKMLLGLGLTPLHLTIINSPGPYL